MNKLAVFLLGVIMVVMTSSSSKTESSGIRELDYKTIRSVNFESKQVSLIEVNSKKFVVVQTDHGVSVCPY